jgi:hypothetical protein
MPTPEEQARALLSSPGLSPDMRSKLEAAINAPSPSAAEAPPDEPAPETQGHVTEMPVQQIEGDVPKPSFWEGFKDTAHDAGMAYSQAGLLGHGDEAFGEYARHELNGTEADAKYNRELYRGELAKGKKRSPKATAIASFAGTLGPALIAGPLGVVGGSAAGGAIQAHGDSDEADADTKLLNMIVGGGAGAAIGELGQGVPEVARWAGTKLGGAASRLGSVADDYLMRATGLSAEDVRKLLGDKLKDYAGKVRELGFDEGLPSARDFGDRAGKAGETFRGKAEAIGQSLGDDAVVPSSDVSTPIRGLKSKYAEGGYASEPKRELVDKVADSWARGMPKKPMRLGPSEPPPTAAPVADRDMSLRLDPEDIRYSDPKPKSDVPDWYEADFTNSSEPSDALASTAPSKSMTQPSEPGTGLARTDAMSRARPSVEGSARFTDDGAIDQVWGFDEGRPEVQGSASFVDDPVTARADVPADDTARVRYGIPFSEAHKERRLWGDGTNWASTDPEQKIRQDVYGAINSGMRTAADRIVPGSGAALRDANWNEHVAIMVRDAARKKALQQTNTIRTPLAAGGGAVGGGIVGMMTGGMSGALSGATTGGMLAGAASKGLQGREHIMMSKAAGALQPFAQGAANKSTALAQGLDKLVSPAAIAGSSQGGAALGAAAAQEIQGQQRAKQASDEGRGQLMPSALQQVLKTNPEALGPFRKQIEMAAQKNEPAVWSATISKLERDVAFRRLRPQILELTKSSR